MPGVEHHSLPGIYLNQLPLASRNCSCNADFGIFHNDVTQMMFGSSTIRRLEKLYSARANTRICLAN